jgi:hypothetical protein
MVKIDKGVLWPQLLAQSFPRHDIASMLQQQDQDLERLRAQFDRHPIAMQLFRLPVQFKKTKSDNLPGFMLLRVHFLLLKGKPGHCCKSMLAQHLLAPVPGWRVKPES